MAESIYFGGNQPVAAPKELCAILEESGSTLRFVLAEHCIYLPRYRAQTFNGSSELSVGDRVLVGGCGYRSRSLMMSGLLPPLSSRTSGGVSPCLVLLGVS